MAIEPCDDRNRLMVLMEKGRLPEDGLILALGDLFRRLVLPGEVRHKLPTLCLCGLVDELVDTLGRHLLEQLLSCVP